MKLKFGLAKRIALGGKCGDEGGGTATPRPVGSCDICRWSGYVPYFYDGGTRISQAVAACKCQMGVWRQERWEKDGKKAKLYFRDLPPSVANTAVINAYQVMVWNQKVCAGLREQIENKAPGGRATSADAGSGDRVPAKSVEPDPQEEPAARDDNITEIQCPE